MTTQRLRRCSAFFFLLILQHPYILFPSQAAAAEVSRTIIVTTPSRIEEPLEETTGSSTVLTAPEIGAQNPTAALEVLRDMHGVNVSETGTIGEEAVLSIRGALATQTLILLDGIRLNSPWRGRFDIGSFPFDDIEQVEVVRGGKSALYGSDAIGGVVHLKTTRGDGPLKVSYTQEVGSESTFREILSAKGEIRKLHNSTTLTRSDTEGQFSRDRFDSTSLSEKLGIPIGNSGRLDLILRYQGDNKELAHQICDICGSPLQVLFDENNKIERRFSMVSVQFFDRVHEWIDLEWKAAIIDTDLHWDNPPDPGGSNPFFFTEDTDTRVLVLDLQQNLLFSDHAILSFGLELQRDEVESETQLVGTSFPTFDRSRRNNAYFLQLVLKADPSLQMLSGVRLDDNSDYGEVTTPDLSMTYTSAATETQIKGSWGKGFRAPTLRDPFLQDAFKFIRDLNGLPLLPSEELRPEKSEDWELGLRQELNKHILEIVYFEIDYTDLLILTPTGPKNEATHLTQGLELLLEAHPFDRIIVKANFTCFEEIHHCFESRTQLKNDVIPFRPWRQANIGLLFLPTAALTINLDINWVDWQPLSADFLLSDGTLVQGKNPGFTRADFSTTYHLFAGFKSLREVRLYLKVRNLFDESYSELPGFPAPRIGFFAGATATF